MDLSEFDLEIHHRPGRYHFLPDWLSRAELIDMDAEGMLTAEIARLDALHDENKSGLLNEDLAKWRKNKTNIVDEVMTGEESLGSVDKAFRDSMVYAEHKQSDALKEMFKKGNCSDLKQRGWVYSSFKTPRSHIC